MQRSLLDTPRPGGTGARGAGALLAGALLVLTAAPGAAQQAASGESQERPLRVAVVNLDRIAADSRAGRALQARIDSFRTQVQARSDSLETAARQVEGRIAAAPDTLAEADRQALEREYMQAVTAYQTYRQQSQQRAQEMQAEGFSRIEEEIEPILEALQAEEDYDLVLNSRAPAVILFSGRLDVTERVLERLAAGG